MIFIDGSHGEGGGQILRTTLALSLITQREVMITNIRAGRAKPGLARQHLAAVNAAAAIGDAEVQGAHTGSKAVVFRPRTLVAGDRTFAIGTAGSTTLVLQTVLPALLCTNARSTITLEGGTHNPMAPPFEFLAQAYLPLVERMGPRVSATLDRRGFYPGGGGRFRVTIDPAPLAPLTLLDRGDVRSKRGLVIAQRLPSHVAEREIATVRARLGWDESAFVVDAEGPAPGNALLLTIESEHVTEVVSSIGDRGVRAELVAERAAKEASTYLASNAPVGEHLADQLVLLLAIAAHQNKSEGGAFRTTTPSLHLKTHIALLEQILGTRTEITEDALQPGTFIVRVRAS
jgi:RNA 3'-terminal phosphate cyclase (ATP)